MQNKTIVILQNFAKYLAKSFSVQPYSKSFLSVKKCFSINYNFIFVVPETWVKIISSNVFSTSHSLKYFLKTALFYKSRNKEVVVFMI